jgi:hypothetical protein
MDKMSFIEKEIKIPGLKGSYRILHVTDAHIILWDERDEDTVITEGYHAGKRLAFEYGPRRDRHFTIDGVTTNDRFAALCDYLKAEGTAVADVVVFTGDILDFYTDAAFEFMVENLNKLPMPYMFVMGNHDAIFSSVGEKKILERFDTLCGGSHKIQKLKLGELTLVGSYNVYYHYDSETLSLIASALEGAEHALMFQHVPINSPSLEEFTESNGFGNIVIGAPDCQNKGNSGQLFMALIDREDSPVRAVICGDSHYNYSGPLTERIEQHVSPLLRDFPPVRFTVSGR